MVPGSQVGGTVGVDRFSTTGGGGGGAKLKTLKISFELSNVQVDLNSNDAKKSFLHGILCKGTL